MPFIFRIVYNQYNTQQKFWFLLLGNLIAVVAWKAST